MKNQNKKSNRINSFRDYLYSLDYKERPVSIDEFIESDQFLGKLTDHGRNVYPIWKETLNEVINEDSKYLVVLTGAIGTGKTTAAIIGVAYIMHTILCLKDPWGYFKKTSGGKMAIIFFNLTKSLSESRGFGKLQSYLMNSEWFKKHGYIGGSEDKPRLEFSLFEYRLASPQAQGFGTIGEDVIIALMDEVDSPIASEPQKKKVIAAYESTVRRFESRFVYDEESIGRFFLVASKQEQLSFLNTFIIQMKNAKNVYIKDIAIWEAHPSSNYCGEKFDVMLGDNYTPPRILNSKEEKEQVIRDGFKDIIQVPIEYRRSFELDIIGSLRDLAGISTSQLRKTKLFASESVLMDCYDMDRKNPVKKVPIDIGLKDDVNLLNFIDLSKIRIPKNVPRYIHIDIAFTGDALGIGMSCVKGWSIVNSMNLDGTFTQRKKPAAETDFAMRLKARPGDQIPIHKVHALILDLKSVCKFNIVKCTFDLKIASTTSMQTLELAGVSCDSLSLDKDPQVYRNFREVVNEGRWTCFNCPFLHFESANLEEDPKKNKIDHPDEVKDVQILDDGGIREIIVKGSKDLIDGVAGSVMLALEDCKTPPDVEVMRGLINKSLSSNPLNVDKGYMDLLNVDVKRSDEKKVKDNNDVGIYKDILRKAIG